MDITMDQLYSEMRKLSEGQAVQAQMLTQVLQRLDQHTQISAQQGAQLAALVTEVSVLKSEVSTRNLEIVSLQSWRADMPNLYIPRKEQEAQDYGGHIDDLREDFTELKKDITAHRTSSFSNAVQWSISVIALLATIALGILSFFHH